MDHGGVGRSVGDIFDLPIDTIRIYVVTIRSRMKESSGFISDNKWSYRDISHSKTVVGYQPKDAAEEHRRDS